MKIRASSRFQNQLKDGAESVILGNEVKRSERHLLTATQNS